MINTITMNLRRFLFCSLVFFVYSCSSSEQVVQQSPARGVTADTASVDFSTMLEPPQDWHHLDEELTEFRGISSRLAYKEILSSRSPQRQVVVAVIDGGVDINHEDLKANIWVNDDEVPDNNTDDDGNGYTDDLNGWNFIGGANGKNVDNDTFEVTRIYTRLHPKYADADTASFTPEEQKEYELYKKVENEYRYQINNQLEQYTNIQSLEQSMERADEILTGYFKGPYDYEDVQNLQPQDQEMAFAQNVMSYVMENDIDSTLIAEQKKQIYEFAKYGYNPDFSPRDIVGDNYADKTERYYGNNDVAGPDPSHGTHVAGIIGAVRNNDVGINGVANNVRIMAIRAVPDGDERDKDVANAIRYAVDNGADIVNMSFGKSYSPYKEVVDAAVKYAEEKGVLLVHGAGNSSENSDVEANYPTDVYGDSLNGPSSSLWLSVGASSWKPNEEFVADFSNYGDTKVDLFAPGVDIYSTMPDNTYERQDGTSMASPVVAGVAALLMSYYPDLTPAQIRSVIMESVKTYPNQEVIVPHKPDKEGTQKPFSALSVSDGVVNVYKALRAAEKMNEN